MTPGAVHFELNAEFAGGETYTVAEFSVDRRITLEPDEHRTVEVDFEFPFWTPLTVGETSVWLETGLDIDWAKDPSDRDRVDVVGDEFVRALLAAVEELGFAMRYSEPVDTPYLDDRPFAREFDFRPTDPDIAAGLDELEVTLMPRGEDLRVFVEFDQRDAVAEEYDMDFDE